MIVYRFEKNGIGPYISRSNAYRITRERMKYRSVQKYMRLQKDQKRSQENIDNYYKVHKSKEYMYGCITKEQLRLYFYGDFKILFKQGFRIKRYNVPDNHIVDLGTEVAFPVRYHKLQSVGGIERKTRA